MANKRKFADCRYRQAGRKAGRRTETNIDRPMRVGGKKRGGGRGGCEVTRRESGVGWGGGHGNR